MAAVKTHSVPSLEKALTILEMLANSKVGLSLPELVLKTGIPKSSVHCLMITLERRGYLHRNEKTGRYMFGLQLFSLANMAVSGLKLRDEGASFLRDLAERTRLTAHMAILDRHEAVLISKCEPFGMFRLATWIGKRMELHCTGLGKALLAHLPQGEIDRIIDRHPLPRHNDNTLFSRNRLVKELAKTAERGYALDDEEDEIGLRCIGAPVLRQDKVAIASISISGTTTQITQENMGMLAQQVMQTAASISTSLSHLTSAPDKLTPHFTS